MVVLAGASRSAACQQPKAEMVAVAQAQAAELAELEVSGITHIPIHFMLAHSQPQAQMEEYGLAAAAAAAAQLLSMLVEIVEGCKLDTPEDKADLEVVTAGWAGAVAGGPPCSFRFKGKLATEVMEVVVLVQVFSLKVAVL